MERKMSIAQNYPAISPSLSLDFAAVQALDPRITYTRASTATYYGTETAKAEENLLLQSQAMSGSPWAAAPQGVATVPTNTANAGAAPDGTTTASRWVLQLNGGTATGDIALVRQTFTPISGAAYTYSVFVKSFDGTSTYDAQIIGADGAGLAIAITGAWTRFTVTANGAATAISFGVRLRGGQSPTNSNSADILVWGAQLEQRSAVTAYTPTTTSPITNYIPVLETAASGVARFDHNPTTFESLGLLIEESRANLILQSEDLDTTWAETRATLSLNSVIAPSGALTADVLIASTDNDTHFTSQTFTGTAAAHTFTVYAKAYGLNHVALRLFNGTAQVGLAYYNLSTGATGTVTAGTAAITSVGNGYYRCSLTATLAASASCTADIQLANADNTNSFAGNAFSGVTLWGAQLEAGAFPTSYIPTVASQVTRAADAASMTGTNFSSWYNQAQGTLYAEASVIGATADAVIASANSGTTNNDIRLRVLSSSNSLGFRVFADGVSQAALSTTNAFTVGQEFKSVGVYKVNDFAFSANGLPVTTDTTGVLGVVTQFQLGAVGAVSVLNGHIRKLSYYPLRATNAQLQGLTS